MAHAILHEEYESRALAELEAESVAFIVKLYEPAAEGIPPKLEITPLLPWKIVTPRGRVEPGATDHVNGGTPPCRLLSR